MSPEVQASCWVLLFALSKAAGPSLRFDFYLFLLIVQLLVPFLRTDLCPLPGIGEGQPLGCKQKVPEEVI